MHIYLLRHGIAEEARYDQPDSERRLIPEGISKMRLEAKGIARLGLRFDIIFSSPYARALQTAQIVAALPDMPEIQVDSGLISGSFRLGELQRLVDGAGREAHLLFVGHEPDMSALTYSLCGAQIAMKKGGLAHIETLRAEPEEGFLRWLLAPGQLALLGE